MSEVTKCARCGRRLPASRPRVYSSWTKKYYCAGVNQCAKRARRNRKVAA